MARDARAASDAGSDAKDQQLQECRVDLSDTRLTTQQGVGVDHTDDSLSVGERGPTLLEDFHAREKITHFDHERIPERVVHARGAGAYGYFQPYDDALAEYTAAEFLTDPSVRTPVFVRFSTVAGSRGSADTVRDVRGFATKFYTRQGNYDLVGNNIPVFFIQDGIKFPDFVHAVKPEPHNEIPQAASAHDNTFRLVDSQGRGTFVKFHWTPALGTHSLVWDECQKIAGKDPDFNRRDLWEALETGAFPEWELGVQLVPESEEFAFGFDLLDATKIIPEERVPVRPVGRLVLDRNPDNFFAETEQVAFHTANVVPGIDFTNDPLLQARNFSYLDTQLIRLGGPNFAQLPVNRPVVPVTNNQRDGYHQSRVHTGRTSYLKNTLGGGCPAIAGEYPEVFAHYQERVDGYKIRKRSESFRDFYSQATLFWNSMTPPEREHIVAAFRFELGKVGHTPVREAVVGQLNEVDHELATLVAAGIGVPAPTGETKPNHGNSSPALSQLATLTPGSITTRKIAVLVADGVEADAVGRLADDLRQQGAVPELLAPADGTVTTAEGGKLPVDRALPTMASVLYDAVVVPSGPECRQALAQDGDALHFVAEAFKHGKALAALGAGVPLLDRAGVRGVPVAGDDGAVVAEKGVVTWATTRAAPPKQFVEDFVQAIARHRSWDRDTAGVPA